MTSKIIQRWLIGLVAGTALVALTSPLFVRTYSPKTWDNTRQRWVYPAGLEYRWRSEGYATSRIGPHGIVGRSQMPSVDSPIAALWGDSQAEGVVLDDRAKLSAILESTLPPVEVISMAGSGEDLRHWIAGISLIEEAWQVDEHWILLSELSDAAAVNTEPRLLAPNPPLSSANQQSSWMNYVPDFVIETGRSLALNSDNQLRELRFTVGPSANNATSPHSRSVRDPTEGHAGHPATTPRSEEFWASVAKLISESTIRPITVVYAPNVPIVRDPANVSDDLDEINFRRLSAPLRSRGVQVIDCRPAFQSSVASGRFPHGFHNGRFGSGHLNEIGNRLIARQMAERLTTNKTRRREEPARSPEI